MRRIERISIILDIIPWYNFIQNTTGLDKLSANLKFVVDNIESKIEDIKKEWLENPDMRLGQLLINMNLAPDIFSLWIVEEDDWLIYNDYCNIEDIKFWGQNYDKNMNRLSETRWVLLKNLTTDHIKGIIKYFKDINRELNEDYLKYFNKRIEDEGVVE